MRKVFLMVITIIMLSSYGQYGTADIDDEQNSQPVPTTVEDDLKVVIDDDILQPVSATVDGSLQVVIEPRIELLTIIQYLGDYGVLTLLDSQYKNDIDVYFGEFREHVAVTTFIELSHRGFWFDAPIRLLINSGQLPELEVSNDLPVDFINRIGGYDTTREFLDYMNEFYEVTNFSNFFEEHRDQYSQIVQDFQSRIRSYESVNTLESYYGTTQNSYTIVMAPLLHYGGYGFREKLNDGGYDAYTVIGPRHLDNSEFVFDAGALIFHEFGHSFVKPLVDLHSDDINEHIDLFEDVQDTMTKMGYGDWITTIEEHIVRAVVIRISLESVDYEEYNRFVEMEYNRGFIYIEDVLKQLEYYENNREKYATFQDFLPVLIHSFEDMNK